jgi:hypothetical protein
MIGLLNWLDKSKSNHKRDRFLMYVGPFTQVFCTIFCFEKFFFAFSRSGKPFEKKSERKKSGDFKSRLKTNPKWLSSQKGPKTLNVEKWPKIQVCCNGSKTKQSLFFVFHFSNSTSSTFWWWWRQLPFVGLGFGSRDVINYMFFCILSSKTI